MPKPGFRPATVSPDGRATSRQVATLQSMFDDLKFTRIQRNAYLENRFARGFHGLDELTVQEASRLIATFVQRRKHEQRQHYPYTPKAED